MTDPHDCPPDNDSPYAHLGLWDAVSIIVGIVVGTSIFKTPQLVFGNVAGPWQGMACWALGGVMALIGSLCYAELATTYPRIGGDYVYLTRAFGRWMGFLFGWAQLAVILTGSIGVMAYAFADYSVAFLGLDAVTCRYTVANQGSAVVKIVSLKDDRGTPDDAKDDVGLELVLAGGDIDQDGELDAGETWTYRAQTLLKQASPQAAKIVVETVPAGRGGSKNAGVAESPPPAHPSGILASWESDREAVQRRVAHWTVWLALGSVLVLTALNAFGVVFGKAAQNLLTAVKVVGLGAIVVVGFVWGGKAPLTSPQPLGGAGFGLAMVFVFYAYGGWNDAAFVAAEVRHRRRNMPLALLLGTGGIMVIYLLVNAAYLWGLGFQGVRDSAAPAADVLRLAWGDWGARAISLLVMLSALGAINGLIFTGSRIYVSLGADHRLFAWLGRWDPRRGVPVRSLLTQSAIALLLIVAVGTETGRSSLDKMMTAVGLNALPWDRYYGGFDTLVAATAPVFWVFFLLTGYSLFLLRAIDHSIQRPFWAPFYPLEPILFCGMCHFMLFSAIDYAKGLSLLGLIPLAVGLPLYAISQWSARRKAGKPAES